MAERKGDSAVVCWSGRWCELSRHHTRREAQAARDRRVEAGGNAKTTPTPPHHPDIPVYSSRPAEAT
jgi:hypothetical protein